VGQEEVERVDDLVDDDASPAHVLKANIDLVRTIEDVGRSAGAQQRHHDGDAQNRDESHGGQVREERVGEVRKSERSSSPQQGPGHEEQCDRQEDEAQA
jgi:hypothetical protein